MNSSFGIWHSDPFDIIEESGSTVPLFGASTRPTDSTPELTRSQSTLIENIDTSA